MSDIQPTLYVRNIKYKSIIGATMEFKSSSGVFQFIRQMKAIPYYYGGRVYLLGDEERLPLSLTTQRSGATPSKKYFICDSDGEFIFQDTVDKFDYGNYTPKFKRWDTSFTNEIIYEEIDK